MRCKKASMTEDASLATPTTPTNIGDCCIGWLRNRCYDWLRHHYEYIFCCGLTVYDTYNIFECKFSSVIFNWRN
jgi:hypothetical protein